MPMRPFAFHVPASSYRRRPSVRLAVTSNTCNPFAMRATVRARRRLMFWLTLGCALAGAFVAGQLVTMFAVVDVCRVPMFGGAL